MDSSTLHSRVSGDDAVSFDFKFTFLERNTTSTAVYGCSYIVIAIFVSPYMMILLFVANIAPPWHALLGCLIKMILPIKITVDCKLVIAPPS